MLSSAHMSLIEICYKSVILTYGSVKMSQDFNTLSLSHLRLHSVQETSVPHNSEVCHLRCVFKLHGEVNSVKNTTIKYG